MPASSGPARAARAPPLRPGDEHRPSPSTTSGKGSGWTKTFFGHGAGEPAYLSMRQPFRGLLLRNCSRIDTTRCVLFSECERSGTCHAPDAAATGAAARGCRGAARPAATALSKGSKSRLPDVSAQCEMARPLGQCRIGHRRSAGGVLREDLGADGRRPGRHRRGGRPDGTAGPGPSRPGRARAAAGSVRGRRARHPRASPAKTDRAPARRRRDHGRAPKPGRPAMIPYQRYITLLPFMETRVVP